MRTIFAEYNPGRNSIDVYISAGYMLRIDCWKAEKNLRTTPPIKIYILICAVENKLIRKIEKLFSTNIELVRQRKADFVKGKRI